MPLDWSPLVALLRQSQTPLLMTHIRPDADGLGSQLALADTLRAMSKAPRVVIASPLPPRYAFLDPERQVIENFHPPGDEFRQVDAIVVLDTGTWGQLGEFGGFLKSMSVPKAVVDHHRTQDDLGGQAFVDVSSEATGRLVHELIQALGVPLAPRAAHYLFMALALDTGWFRHSNTTARTFALAAELVAAGANPTPLYDQLFECASLGRLKLAGLALDRLELHAGGRIAITEIYLSDYTRCHAVPGDTEDLINFPRSIEGVEVALILIEQPEGGTKVSFRARSKVDVSKLAEHFGGGGHRLAAGARLADQLPIAKQRVLAATLEALQAAGVKPGEAAARTGA